MSELEALQLKYDELEIKYKKKCDFAWDITCKFLSLKTRIGLYIINPLNNLLNRNDKLKPEYKLGYINKKLIVEILDEIEKYEIETDEKFQKNQINAVNCLFYDIDKRGVRPFVRYSNASGGWAIECYRKKREDESKGDSDWEMVREGHIQSYGSRKEAEQKVLELAEQICLENGY